MDVKEAVSRAKTFLSDVFSDESISEMRLEEVEFDRCDGAWLITLGLLRPSVDGRPGQLATMMNARPVKRAYKVVRIPEHAHELPSIKIREFNEG